MRASTSVNLARACAKGAKMSEDATPTQVVRNTEGQYSIWPIDQEVPAGWHPTGVSRTPGLPIIRLARKDASGASRTVHCSRSPARNRLAPSEAVRL